MISLGQASLAKNVWFYKPGVDLSVTELSEKSQSDISMRFYACYCRLNVQICHKSLEIFLRRNPDIWSD